ncbi:MAG: hypothetical protein N4A72_18790 [Bacteroidales bacterium]|jgi:hypothetical protein|nr:hypothetical protein [Bacteroidales bacterium]
MSNNPYLREIIPYIVIISITLSVTIWIGRVIRTRRCIKCGSIRTRVIDKRVAGVRNYGHESVEKLRITSECTKCNCTWTSTRTKSSIHQIRGVLGI